MAVSNLGLASLISPIFVCFCSGKPGEAEPGALGRTARQREARLALDPFPVGWAEWVRVPVNPALLGRQRELALRETLGELWAGGGP